jgi:hypothetical protein
VTAFVDDQRQSAGHVQRLLVTNALSSPPNVHVDEPRSYTDPDVVTSPLRADGQAPATGLSFMFTSDGVSDDTAGLEATTAGFTVTVWIRNPITGHWGKTAPISLRLNEWAVTFDTNGGDLYFQFDPLSFLNGDLGGMHAYLDVHVVEL